METFHESRQQIDERFALFPVSEFVLEERATRSCISSGVRCRLKVKVISMSKVSREIQSNKAARNLFGGGSDGLIYLMTEMNPNDSNILAKTIVRYQNSIVRQNNIL
jgi:hypothetical protein